MNLCAALAIVSVLAPLSGLCHTTKEKQATIDFSAYESALRMYRLNVGAFPNGSQGLRALVERPADLPPKAVWGKVMDRLNLDPWGNDYQYLTGDGLPDGHGIFSRGPDGVSATQGNDPDDINSWSDWVKETQSPWTWPRIAKWAFAIGVGILGSGIIGFRLGRKSPMKPVAVDDS